MSELPKGWVRGSLGDILRIRNGYAFKSTEFKLDGVPLVRQSNLDGDKVDLTKCVYLDEQYLLDRAGFTLCKGDVLIGMSGSVGKLCTYDQDFVALQNQRVGKIELHASSQTEWRFVWHYLKTVTGALLEKAKGVAVANVSPDDIHSLALNIPPLAEQTRIAAKLDELLAQVDTLKARIDGIPSLLKRFRQSVLAAAVSGRLTEEWRGIQSDGEPESGSSDLPAGWSAVPLGRYAINHDGARKPISAKERESRKGDHPYFGATGQIDSIDGYTHDGEFVLVGEDGANLLTRVKPIAFIAKGQIWVNNHAHVIASPSAHSNAYLAIYLNTLDITPWVSGSAQPKLNQKNMNEIPVHVPPPAEQTEIVHRVEQLFAFADQLEAKVNEAKARIDRLTQSILAKAFRGELVPQDPNDEPASQLLERIKAQHAAAPKARRKRRVGAD